MDTPDGDSRVAFVMFLGLNTVLKLGACNLWHAVAPHLIKLSPLIDCNDVFSKASAGNAAELDC